MEDVRTLQILSGRVLGQGQKILLELKILEQFVSTKRWGPSGCSIDGYVQDTF